MKKRGRKALARGTFNCKHKHADSHITRIRDEHHIPVILGATLPHKDREPDEHEQWCRAMLILFKPWRDPKDIKEDYTSWKSAFLAFQFSETCTNVIRNIHIEQECRDAKIFSEERRTTNHQYETGTSDMESLGVTLQNDPLLLDDDLDEFNSVESEYLAADITGTSQINYTDKTIQDAEKLGLFSKNRFDNLTNFKPSGDACCLQVGDIDIIAKQTEFMNTLKRNKRPARAIDGELTINPPKKFKQIKGKSSIGIAALEHINFTAVPVHSEKMPDPINEIENIIEETGIKNSNDQIRAFRIAAEHFLHGTQDQLFLYIMGVGGTGKSFVIDAIVKLFQRCGAPEKLQLSAPTGSAAVLIGGYTIHALTFLPKNKYKPDAKMLEAIWKDVRYLVIDEISMVSPALLSQILHRICEAKAWDPIVSAKPFGV